jgi:hypothetical protein
MLRSLRDLHGYHVRAADGDVGRADDFLFDDERWTVRYAVVDTGGWMEEALTLISPVALREADWESRTLVADLTRDQVESSPPIDRDAPVDRQRRVDLHAHYGWPYWWAGVGPLGGIGAPGAYVPAEAAPAVAAAEPDEPGDPHLRSSKDVIGYGVTGTDEPVGHVEDLIVDDEGWEVRYLVVDTRNWLPGRKVLIAPEWVERFDWGEYTAALRLTRAQIEAAPEFDASAPVNREYETRLYDFYGRPTYWDE